MQSKNSQNKDKSNILIFNENLNQSSSLIERMDWFKSYREKITHWLNTLIVDQNVTNLCVIAAGNLADVDYLSLQESSLTSVVLTDIDLKGMQEGYSYQNLEKVSHHLTFTLRAINYLGEESEDLIRTFLQEMHRQPQNPQEKIDDLINKLAHSIDKMTTSSITSLPVISQENHTVRGYDGVLVLPIYTQLLFFQLDVELHAVSCWQANRHYFFSQMASIIERFNQWVVSLVKQGGSLLVFSDIIEEKLNEPEMTEPEMTEPEKNESKSTFLKATEISSQVVCKAIDTYEAMYGHGLGSYGLLNMAELASQQEEYYLSWRFDQERRFLVKGVRFIVTT